MKLLDSGQRKAATARRKERNSGLNWGSTRSSMANINRQWLWQSKLVANEIWILLCGISHKIQPAHEIWKPKYGHCIICSNLKQKIRLLGSFHIPATVSYSVYSRRKSGEMLNTIIIGYMIYKRRMFIKQVNNYEIYKALYFVLT